MRRSARQSGVALLLTLLVVTLLTIVVIEFTYSTEVEAHLTRNALSALQARYLARAGLTLAETVLKLDIKEKTANPPLRPNADSLLDAWAQPFPPRPMGDGVGDGGFRIDDESSRFNVNALVLRPGVNPVMLEARKNVFQGILAALGIDVNLLFPLLDWLDPDDEVTGKNGAEKDYYLALTPPYEPRNGRALSFDELRLIRGFEELTREQWTALRTVLTVLPNEELQINLNTASELLLTGMLGAVDAAAAAKAIIARREQNPFVNATDLNEIPGWSQLPAQVRGNFTEHSAYFTIHAVGVAANVSRGLAVLERRSGQRLDVLDRREEPGSVALTSPAPSDGINSFTSMSR
ncbi:MAG TPA: type II secretion system minor pseudopilin GspK [Candidatus Binatia bacterium]|nr:type II secretion system minor pseudopilin GspK [Candidatus Binatia bacterium]